jgi:hypothetical protein
VEAECEKNKQLLAEQKRKLFEKYPELAPSGATILASAERRVP